MNPSLLRTLWRSGRGRFGLVVIACFVLAALWGEIACRRAQSGAAPAAYQETHMEQAFRPPLTPGHPLGTDGLGRDVALRLVQGARIAFQVGVVTSLMAIPLGLLMGLLAGYFRGRVDDAIVWIYTTFASIPGLLFTLAIAMLVGKGLAGVYLGIGLTTWVGLCRLIRAETMKIRERAFVDAARVLGAGHAVILFRHILPNVMHLVIVSFTLRFPQSIGTEVFLSFLGIGAQGEPSWGVMIASARMRLWQGIWWEMTFVTLAIFLVVLAFNLLGDVLRDALDPRAKEEA